MAEPLPALITDIGDPENRGRVRVRCAAMGTSWEKWAEVLRPDPALPAPAWGPGEAVMILFEAGDPGSPLVLGALSPYRNPARADHGTGLPQPNSGWDDLAVSPAARRGLQRLVATAPAGAVAVFSGPSGIDKTMAAQVVAKALGKSLLIVDLARVVSQYIGETEKNLDAVFSGAEAGGDVLFFDEADALFGRRSGVKDSHDRYANIEVGYLLQRIGHHPGLIILATNRKRNIDPAFTRRLRAIISFPGPRR